MTNGVWSTYTDRQLENGVFDTPKLSATVVLVSLEQMLML